MCIFFLKNTFYRLQEKQNTEHTVKNLFFLDSARLLNPADFDRDKILKKKNIYTPQIDWSTHKKIYSPIDPTVREKKGENFIFLFKN